jgi:hypothetical protein
VFINTEIYVAKKGSILRNPFFKRIFELAVINVIRDANRMAIYIIK